MLKLTDIKKDYKVASGAVHALKGVSLEFRRSEFVCILGPSGCGKTTLLNIIGGLDHYTSGDLVIQGKSTKDFKDRDWDVYRNHRIGFVFQTYNLIPHQTVLSNVELALTIAGVGGEERKKRAAEVLERVGLGKELDKKPNQLSGGQMQRVAIARALVNDPDILLADEPTGALDSKTSVQIMDLMQEIAAERLVIMVTHNPELAEQYATRIVRLHDGLVEADSNPYDSEREPEGELAVQAAEPAETAEGHTMSEVGAQPAAEPAEGETAEEPTMSESKAQPASAEPTAEKGRKKKKKEKKPRAKMGFFTSLALSAMNLLTKKGRTAVTSIAGSIGIISVCLVLALSNGFGNYIRRTEEEMLSAYPIEISESTFDLSSVMNAVMSPKDMPDLNKLGDKVYINSFLTGLAQGMAIQNNVTPEYLDYIDDGMEKNPEDYAAVQYGYGFKLADALFTPMETTNKGKFYFTNNGEYDENNSLELKYANDKQSTDPTVTSGTWTMSLKNSAAPAAEATVTTGEYVSNSNANTIELYTVSGEEKTLYASGTRAKGDAVEEISVKTTNGAQTFNFSRDIFVRRYFSVNALKQYLIDELMAEADQYSNLLQFVHYFTDVVNKMPGTSDFNDPNYAKYVQSQYDIVNEGGHLPQNEHEAVMVIGPNNDVIDLTLVQLGFLDEEQFLDLFRDAQAAEETETIAKTSATTVTEGGETLTPAEAKKRLAFDRILEQNYVLYYSDALYNKVDNFQFASVLSGGRPFEYVRGNYSDHREGELGEEDYKTALEDTTDAEGIDFKITAILRLKDGLSYGCLQEGLNLPEATVTSYIQNNIDHAETNPDGIMAWLMNGKGNADKYISLLSPELAGMGLHFYISPAKYLDEYYTFQGQPISFDESTVLHALGGSEEVSELSIYPTGFEAKQHIKDYLDEWNDTVDSRNKEVKAWNEAHPDDQKPLYENITYTDQMGMLMGMIQTIFNLISYVLVAFTAISLIVSSVMIGIITYVSVIERVKEIGILRSLGASKLDIKNLFNAETFIIGLASGIFGVIVAYIFSGIISLILQSVTGIAGIAALAPLTAFVMICVSVVLTLISGLIPASAAAKKDPVIALRTE